MWHVNQELRGIDSLHLFPLLSSRSRLLRTKVKKPGFIHWKRTIKARYCLIWEERAGQTRDLQSATDDEHCKREAKQRTWRDGSSEGIGDVQPWSLTMGGGDFLWRNVVAISFLGLQSTWFYCDHQNDKHFSTHPGEGLFNGCVLRPLASVVTQYSKSFWSSQLFQIRLCPCSECCLFTQLAAYELQLQLGSMLDSKDLAKVVSKIENETILS